ncbi:hypothetical protein SAMN05444143_101686 [Flavobacterium succinicans]|uniref:Uncharacterized protein n=1 Tax=Flavobacterium succinicans TaxID=29536 RepID=A0A1I4S5R5_9FLAO|nr:MULTISPECIES: hypothetical protein [Flavobacterium]OOV29170.1 hypothetical protein BXU11_04410 [Flavobacterium sp. LM5]SFM59837.1 hypothetical protein SAMN05444143_101686 [Flavobacterium succinicans]
MQAIPVKVKNVSVYPYVDWNGGGVGPVILPVIEGASGTYAVGTLIMSAFYNLDLDSGNQSPQLVMHQRYVAMGETEDGAPFTTPWMYCTNTSNQPQFGRTIRMNQQDSETINMDAAMLPAYITLGSLTDITVSQLFSPPAIGELMLIENGSGNVIATKTGTPHEMGVEVVGGKRVGTLRVGMKNIMITGKNKEGKTFTMGNLTCLSSNETALFLQEFKF